MAYQDSEGVVNAPVINSFYLRLKTNTLAFSVLRASVIPSQPA